MGEAASNRTAPTGTSSKEAAGNANRTEPNRNTHGKNNIQVRQSTVKAVGQYRLRLLGSWHLGDKHLAAVWPSALHARPQFSKLGSRFRAP